MPVEIHRGDIFDARADALIVPANSQPDLGWGSHISERVAKMADASVIKQRQALGTIELGSAGLTGGAGTPFKHLIHAAVLDKCNFNPLFLLRLRQRTSDETLERAVSSSIDVLKAHSIESAAISAMGAGIGGMSYRKCLSIIIPRIAEVQIRFVFAAYKPRHAKMAAVACERLHLEGSE